MTIEQSEINDVTKYLRSLCIRSGVKVKSIDDIVQETLADLLPEWEEISAQGKLFYWAKIRLTAARSRVFAAAEPVSGISRMAHYAGRLYLQAADWDVDKAYANQFRTVKVSKRLLQALTSKHRGLSPDEDLGSRGSWVLDAHDQPEQFTHPLRDELLAIMADVLTARELRVVWLRLGYDEGKTLTLAQIAEELGLSVTTAQREWASALTKLGPRVRDIVSM